MTALNSSKLPRTFAAFQHPAYRIIWPANFCSLLSRWMQMTLLGWMVLTLTDSAWRVSLVGFFSLAPMLFVGLVSGVLADRFDRLKLLRVTQVVGFAAALGMAAVLVLGKEEFWHAYVTITLVGSAWALELPTRRSMIHDLVGSSGVTNAVALDSIGMNASAMVGPALAGVLISQVDVVGGYVVVVGFSVVSMVMVWTLRLDIGRRASAAKRRMTLDLLVGVRYTLRHRTLLAVVLITIVMNVLFFPYRFLIPVIARDVLGVGPDLMGLMDSIAGLGASAGAIAIASSTNVRRHGLIFIGGSVVAAVCLMGFSFSKVYLLSLALLLVLGAGTAGFLHHAGDGGDVGFPGRNARQGVGSNQLGDRHQPGGIADSRSAGRAGRRSDGYCDHLRGESVPFVRDRLADAVYPGGDDAEGSRRLT